MREVVFLVTPKLGLHARPASLFVQTASRFQAKVLVRKGNQQIDGKSIMGLLMLAAENGAKLYITVDGIDENDVISALSELFEKKFDEE